MRSVGVVMVMVIAGLAPAGGALSQERFDRAGLSVQIIDESNAAKPGAGDASLDAVSDPNFKKFVKSVSAHLSAVASKQAAVPGERPDIKLLFVRRPLMRADQTPPIASELLNLPHVAGARLFESPWVKVTVLQEPRRAISAVIVWSERQLLLDQALLSGGAEWPGDELSPLQTTKFGELKMAFLEHALSRKNDSETGELRKRIPPDVLWLFRQSWTDSRGAHSGFAESSLQDTIARISGTYAIFATALLDRAINSTAAEQRFNSVFDLRERTSESRKD